MGLAAERSPPMQGTHRRDSFRDLEPKASKRFASEHEIKMLVGKSGNETKVKRAA